MGKGVDPLIDFMADHAGDDETYTHAELMISLTAFAIWVLEGTGEDTDGAVALVQRFMDETL
jgi:hypothetical protein